MINIRAAIHNCWHDEAFPSPPHNSISLLHMMAIITIKWLAEEKEDTALY